MGNEYKLSCGQLVGRSHLPNNIPCQDSVIVKTENGVTLAVLSDGCGSATLSHEGSKITVESTAKLLIDKFDELYELDDIKISLNILKTIVGSQIKYIKENREAINERIIEFKTRAQKDDSEKPFDVERLKNANEYEMTSYFYGTLCFIAIKGDKAMIGQIGDGRVGLVIDNNLFIALQEVKNDAVNGTVYPANALFRYLKNNDENECKELRIVKYQNVNIQAGFVVSDGCDALIEYVDKDKGLFFRIRFNAFSRNTLYGVFNSESQEEADSFIMERLEKIRATTDDDCSIGVIVKDLPEDPNAIERKIFVKPGPNDEPKEEEEEETEEEYEEEEQYASKIFGDLFKDYVDSGAISADVYDVIDQLGFHAQQDKSVTIEQLVDGYLIIIKGVLESKEGAYYQRPSQDQLSDVIWEILKKYDTLFSWPNNGICKKVTKKK